MLRTAALVAAALGAAIPAQAAPSSVDFATADRCDPIDPANCLYPFPNDHYTVRDRHTSTERRVSIDPRSMPANASGARVSSSDYSYADGFSPGALIVTKVPGLDTPAALAATGAVPITDLARTYDRRQPVVLINARTHRRQLIWAELDSNASTAEGTALIIHPAKNLREGERYIVALRRLRGADGRRLEPSGAFKLYRDGIRTRSWTFERRRRHMESIFRSLRKAGIERHELYRAWDFTVASAKSLSGRLRAIRDDAFGQLGDRKLADLKVSGKSPAFTLDKVTDFAACGSDGCQSGEDDVIRRRVEGHVTVPCYLDQPGCPAGSRFSLGPDGLPRRLPGNTHQANFICNIPRSVDSAHPGRVSLYGHGLFGGAGEVNSISRLPIASEHRIVLCASDWIGMSGGDLTNTVTILQDLSRFPTLADRLQQGMINFLFLGRAMIHPGGFAADPAFRDAGGPLIQTRRLYFSGGSQGGIAGGALTGDRARLHALGPDRAGHELQPAADPQHRLRPLQGVLYPSYPDELDRPLILSLIQMLWDRGEPNGYAQHMTDRSVSEHARRTRCCCTWRTATTRWRTSATEVEARTIGAQCAPAGARPGPQSRTSTRSTGSSRSAVTRTGAAPWWSGTSARFAPPAAACPAAPQCDGTGQPPITNTAPRLGRDPHGITGREPPRSLQFSRFIEGEFIDVCGGKPCHAAGWT